MKNANTTLQLGSLVLEQPPNTCDHSRADNRLDKFWANEEVRFDYKANLSGKMFLNIMLRFCYYAL